MSLSSILRRTAAYRLIVPLCFVLLFPCVCASPYPVCAHTQTQTHIHICIHTHTHLPLLLSSLCLSLLPPTVHSQAQIHEPQCNCVLGVLASFPLFAPANQLSSSPPHIRPSFPLSLFCLPDQTTPERARRTAPRIISPRTEQEMQVEVARRAKEDEGL